MDVKWFVLELVIDLLSQKMESGRNVCWQGSDGAGYGLDYGRPCSTRGFYGHPLRLRISTKNLSSVC